MICKGHVLPLGVLAVDPLFVQFAALAEFNGTLRAAQGEVLYDKDSECPCKWNDASSVPRK